MKRVEEDRTIAIEAAIVRIMKVRREEKRREEKKGGKDRREEDRRGGIRCSHLSSAYSCDITHDIIFPNCADPVPLSLSLSVNTHIYISISLSHFLAPPLFLWLPLAVCRSAGLPWTIEFPLFFWSPFLLLTFNLYLNLTSTFCISDRLFLSLNVYQARKTLAHQQLVAEVLTQLNFFKPDPKVRTSPCILTVIMQHKREKEKKDLMHFY